MLEARGGVEPRACPPGSSQVRFRRPMPGTRATMQSLCPLWSNIVRKNQPQMTLSDRGAHGETRTHDTGFAIRRLSRLATRANWNGRRDSNSRIEFGRLACFQLHHFRANGRGGQNRTVTTSAQNSDASVTPHPVEIGGGDRSRTCTRNARRTSKSLPYR